ncbi:MAG: hypothetical protein JWO38_5945 [Gemmataceae bacterium]|nr:hypothetical protein [Gemmataceae bacterium]
MEAPHTRPYRSIFGTFTLSRTVYGSREGQQIVAVPLDNRLRLPASDYSYLLQDWDQMLCTEQAFAPASRALKEISGVTQSVDSPEAMNQQMADASGPYRDARPTPAGKDEGEVFVVSADGQGIVMRKPPGEGRSPAHRTKGQKANRKRMAVIGAIYSVGRYIRTPAQMTAALSRDARSPDGPSAKRPVPVGKHVWGRLSQSPSGSPDEPMTAVFRWLGDELARRTVGATGQLEVVGLMDGQESLWTARREHLGRPEVVELLDILHVTPRLWRAAHLFHREGSDDARGFVRERVQQMLDGRVRQVVRSFRQLGRKPPPGRRKPLRTICRYLGANASRMRYAAYLGKGYPIASGVIEGACRHYVRDRMERAGMRWTKAGAQAMLDVRSEYVNGDWKGFQQFRIERETERLYPHRKQFESAQWPIAA